MRISSDKRLNEQLQEEVSTLRDIMISANKHHSSRFTARKSKDRPSMIITDTETNQETEVGLYAYREVMKALIELFED